MRYSIIVTVRNRQAMLDRCLASIAMQDWQERETIVVDYGSSPPAQALPNMLLIRQEANEWNESIVKNVGIANARGERIAIINCDCIVAPDLITSAHRLLEFHGWDNAQVYWQRFDTFPDWEQSAHLVQPCLESGDHETLIKNYMGYWHPLCSWGDFIVIDRNIITMIGGFDERMTGWGGMDGDMMRRLNTLGLAPQWGLGLKLIHQYHEAQPGHDETGMQNAVIAENSAGKVIRNGGKPHLDLYKI